LIGFPFFARYHLTIDYQGKTLTFVPTKYNPPDVMKKLMTSLLERDRPRSRVLAPAAQWGFKVYKDTEDGDSGVTVKAVLDGSAAARAGLEVGDRLLSLDGRWTDTVAECYRAAEHVKPGRRAKIVVQRKDKKMVLTVMPVAGI
jgi:S1-C subfamily serine protease